jgi:hypothetical protein
LVYLVNVKIKKTICSNVCGILKIFELSYIIAMRIQITFGLIVKLPSQSCDSKCSYVHIRDGPRFFDQVGHQTTIASIGNKHFFTR